MSLWKKTGKLKFLNDCGKVKCRIHGKILNATQRNNLSCLNLKSYKFK